MDRGSRGTSSRYRPVWLDRDRRWQAGLACRPGDRDHMTDDDDLQERIDALLEAFNRMCERHMEIEFEHIAERYEQEAPPHPFPYQPDTEHPAYVGQANMVRRFMAEGRGAIVLPVPLSRRAWLAPPGEMYPSGPSFEKRIL